jgi:hypothetical protein
MPWSQRKAGKKIFQSEPMGRNELKLIYRAVFIKSTPVYRQRWKME